MTAPSAPGLEGQLLERLGEGPSLLVDLAGAIGRGLSVTEGLLRELKRTGRVVEEANDVGIYVWRLRDPPEVRTP